MRFDMPGLRRVDAERTSGAAPAFRGRVPGVSAAHPAARAAVPWVAVAALLAAAACARAGDGARPATPLPPREFVGISLPDSAPLALLELRGAEPGPTVALVAGVHGGKRAAVAALRELAGQLEAERLHGTVLLLPVANVAGHLAGLAQLSPLDSLNLNRVFPGRPDGRPTERLAYRIMQEVVARSDYLADLHGSDGDEAVGAFAYAARPGLVPATDSAALDLARLWGAPRVVWDTAGPRTVATSRFLQTAAHLSGVPAITVFEAGETRDDSAATAAFVRGARRLLTGLGVLEMGDGRPMADAPVLHPRREVATAEAAGAWTPAVRPEQTIAAGELLGTVVDSVGGRRALRAVTAGVVLHVRRAGPVTAGTPLVIAAPPSSTP